MTAADGGSGGLGGGISRIVQDVRPRSGSLLGIDLWIDEVFHVKVLCLGARHLVEQAKGIVMIKQPQGNLRRKGCAKSRDLRLATARWMQTESQSGAI